MNDIPQGDQTRDTQGQTHTDRTTRRSTFLQNSRVKPVTPTGQRAAIHLPRLGG
jgi:hypothetical protein